MLDQLDSIDPMVLTLRSEVEKVVSDDTRFRFEICVTEALTNLVTHAQKEVSDIPIEIEMNLQQNHVSIEIFDPVGTVPYDISADAKNLSDVDPMDEGGRGVGLIMELADQVNYGPSGPRNRLYLEFRDTPTSPISKNTNGAMQ